MRVLPHTILGAEVILESYAEVYSNQFMTGNRPTPASTVKYSAQQSKKSAYDTLPL